MRNNRLSNLVVAQTHTLPSTALVTRTWERNKIYNEKKKCIDGDDDEDDVDDDNNDG